MPELEALNISLSESARNPIALLTDDATIAEWNTEVGDVFVVCLLVFAFCYFSYLLISLSLLIFTLFFPLGTETSF